MAETSVEAEVIGEVKMRLLFLLAVSLSPFFALASNADKPIHIESDTLQVRQEEGVAFFDGNVQAVQGDFQLFADEMTVYYTTPEEKKKTGQEIKKIVVAGNVRLVTPKEQASGSSGIYDILKQEVELRGNVALAQGQNIVTGQRLLHNVKLGRSQLFSTTKKGKKTGRVKGVFIPKAAGDK